MGNSLVPATTRVRRNRARHIPTARLLRRRARLVGSLRGDTFATRINFANRAAELHAIDTVLLARGVITRRAFG